MLAEIKHKIDSKTKPIGALGKLEEIATQICLVQNTLHPQLQKPTILVFASDHGIAKSGVSAYPSEVTAQMVLNFLGGGAAINVLCRQHAISLKIVDAGVNFDFAKNENLINAKIAKGTQNILFNEAMSIGELDECFEKASNIVDSLAISGCNVVGFGEMGIGNTSSASLLMSRLCNLPIKQCVGRGTGLDNTQLAHKLAILEKVLFRHKESKAVKENLASLGGFEIAQICGGMLAAYERNMLILVDGFIASVAYLCAYQLNPNVKGNAIFCHQSDEQGHKTMLEYFGGTPILSLGMRLGEGSGCAVAYPIIESAVCFMNEMSSFTEARVSEKK
ncbi:MAG: nicotinate-nucleotide--dimethylbenzimidazole phosphoribosyltransferase [Bacteroidota bacterium]